MTEKPLGEWLLKALAQSSDDDDRPEVQEIERDEIQRWALTEGGLPDPSARAFAAWLDRGFYDWSEDGDLTNEQVLKGARAHWVGEA